MKASELFSFPESLPFREFFSSDVEPWAWVPRIAAALQAFQFEHPRPGLIPPGLFIEGPVYFGLSVRLPHYGTIIGPAWIGDRCELRPGVFIRGNVIAGAGTILGHACEYKNCLLLEGVETPHFNYVGDSVLGNHTHLGAGAICANLKLRRDEVVVRLPDNLRHGTGMRKLGALMGDRSEAGCNCVLQPGTILGRSSAVLASTFHGTLAPNALVFPDSSPRIRE